MTLNQQRDEKGKWKAAPDSVPRAEQNRRCAKHLYWKYHAKEKAKRRTESYKERRRNEAKKRTEELSPGTVRMMLKGTGKVSASDFPYELVALKTALVKLKRILNENHSTPD